MSVDERRLFQGTLRTAAGKAVTLVRENWFAACVVNVSRLALESETKSASHS